MSAGNFELVAKFLAEVKGTAKALKDRRVAVTKPMRMTLENVEAPFREAEIACGRLETMIKEKLAKYSTATAEKTEAAELRAAELAASGDATGAQAVLATLSAELDAGHADGLSMSEQWDYEVIAVDLLPKGFLLPNRGLLRGELRRQVKSAPNETPCIPGCRIFRKTVVSSKSTDVG